MQSRKQVRFPCALRADNTNYEVVCLIFGKKRLRKSGTGLDGLETYLRRFTKAKPFIDQLYFLRQSRAFRHSIMC